MTWFQLLDSVQEADREPRRLRAGNRAPAAAPAASGDEARAPQSALMLNPTLLPPRPLEPRAANDNHRRHPRRSFLIS